MPFCTINFVLPLTFAFVPGRFLRIIEVLSAIFMVGILQYTGILMKEAEKKFFFSSFLSTTTPYVYTRISMYTVCFFLLPFVCYIHILGALGI